MRIVEEKNKRVQPYNFKRPDRISKNQLRSLHFIHDRFSRNFSSSVSAYLRTDIVFPLIDRLLGGEGNPIQTARRMTEIEQSILQTVMRLIVDRVLEPIMHLFDQEFHSKKKIVSDPTTGRAAGPHVHFEVT